MQRFKKIKLTQGKYALVDAEDFEWLSQYNWMCRRNRPLKYKGNVNFYVYRNTPRNHYVRETVYMHWELLGVKNVDHINGNGLDNRRANLRVCSKSQNQWNRRKSHKNYSGYKNVKFDKRRKTYYSGFYVNKKYFYVGSFKTAKTAYNAYIKKVKEIHGEFARWK